MSMFVNTHHEKNRFFWFNIEYIGHVVKNLHLLLK